MRNSSLLLSGLALSFALAGAAFAQDTPERYRGVSTTGEKGIRLSVKQIMQDPDIVSPARMLAPVLKNTESEAERENLGQNPAALPGSQWPPAPPVTDKGGRDHGTPYSPQTIGLQWAADTSGSIFPPDSHGAVGPTQVLVTTNSRVKVFDKAGTVGGLNVTLDSFFNSVRNAAGTSDPRATFDRITNRWFVIAINVSSPNRLLVAVSSGPTITNAASFTFFFVNIPSAFNDYPSLGVDAQGVYVGENTFNTALTAYLGTNVTCIQKSSILGAGPIFSTRFNTSGSTGTGVFAPRGVDNDDPASTDGYVIGPDNAVFSLLTMRKIFNPGSTTPTISGNLTISVPTTANPFDPPTSGGTAIDTLDDRIFHAQMRLNRKTGQRTIWASHNIRGTNTGAGSAAGDRNVSRWYQVNPIPGAPTLLQSGTAFESGTTAISCIIPSCNMSGQGHMAIAFNTCASTQRIAIEAAGRLHGDAAGSTQARTQAFLSGSGYNPGLNRWGDYSAVCVDPTDDQTMWTMQEFANSTTTWGVRVVKLIAPPPSAVNTLTPNTIAQGATVNITVAGTAAAGSEYYDTDASYPNRLAAAFSGTGLTVNSITFSHANPQQVVLNVTASGGATPGARDITLTNPDGQAVTGVAKLTVTGGTSTETLAPTAEQFVRGQGIAGNLGSWAADDANPRDVRKFIVVNQTEAFIRINLDYTTTKLNPTAISFVTKAKMLDGGVFRINLFLRNDANAFVEVLPETAIGLSFATFTGNAAGTLTDFVGNAGEMRGQIAIRQAGPSTAILPRSSFETGNMVVTG